MPRALLAVVAVVLVFTATPSWSAPCAGFSDVDDSSAFCTSVAWIKNRGITLGCGDGSAYCPNDFVTRLQMAAFLYRLGAQNAFLQGGNAFAATAVLGTTDANALEAHANGERVMRLEPNAISPNVVAGHPSNAVLSGVRGATIAGGGVSFSDTDPDFESEVPNLVRDHYGAIGGGYANLVGNADLVPTNAAFATVGGGKNNQASFGFATIGGGEFNGAYGSGGTIGGGRYNLVQYEGGTIAGGRENGVQGLYGTVPGGYRNVASADYSFAAGNRATADQMGCMVFANWSNTNVGGSCLGSSHIARFLLDHGLSVDYFTRRSDGGGDRWVYIGDLAPGITIATWTGAVLTDTGVWTNASDRALKDGLAAVDTHDVLERLLRLPIARWHYRLDGPAIAHVGPTAQDFRAAFGLGHDDKGIGTVDADGVALAAIQGLNAKLETKVAAQSREIAELRRLLEELLAQR